MIMQDWFQSCIVIVRGRRLSLPILKVANKILSLFVLDPPFWKIPNKALSLPPSLFLSLSTDLWPCSTRSPCRPAHHLGPTQTKGQGFRVWGLAFSSLCPPAHGIVLYVHLPIFVLPRQRGRTWKASAGAGQRTSDGTGEQQHETLQEKSKFLESGLPFLLLLPPPLSPNHRVSGKQQQETLQEKSTSARPRRT